MNAPLRVMIVDDEAPAREGLRLRLKREENILVLGEFGDAGSALTAIRADVPDLLFLDVSMPGIDGFGLLQRLEGIALPSVVFVTAHDAYAVQAFRVHAFDYLLKPVEQSQLHEVLERLRLHVGRNQRAELANRMEALLREVREGAQAGRATERPDLSNWTRTDRLPVRGANGAIQLVSPIDIDWVEAAGDGVKLHVGKTVFPFSKTIGGITSLLDERKFVRIHRSTVVNMDRVRELQPYFHGEYVVVLRDGTKLKLSRGYRNSVSRLLGEQP